MRQPDIAMEDSRKKEFEDYITERFPPGSKRSTSGVVYAAFGKKVATCLKDPTAGDKNFRFWIKKRGFQLLNLPSLGAQDVLVVPVNTKWKEVRSMCAFNILFICYELPISLYSK